MKKLYFLLLLLAMVVFAQAQNNSCGTAKLVCFDSTNLILYPAGVNSPPAPPSGNPGPKYGCLGSQPNPAWFYVKVMYSGDIELYMEGSGPNDIDYACWGPFNSLNSPSPCHDSLTAGSLTPTHHAPGPSADYPSEKMIDCSFSASFEEWCYIPQAIAGKYYLIMITNYSNQHQNIEFSQSNVNQPGAGRLDCIHNIITNMHSNNPACSGDTIKLFAPFYSNSQYTWIGPDNFISTLQNPVILNTIPANSGIYYLTITDSMQNHFYGNINIQISQKPVSAFQYTITNQSVIFNNVSLNSNMPFWFFGDGQSSSLLNPVHAYATSGVYNVTLYSFNNCDFDSTTEQITLSALGINETEKNSISISPNPGKDIFNVRIPENINVIAYEVTNAEGQIMIPYQTSHLNSNQGLAIDLTGAPKHVYFLKMYTSNKPFIYKIIKL